VKMAGYVRKKLDGLMKTHRAIKKIKAVGLMIGVELNIENGAPIYERCVERGLLINCTQGNILRIMPPLCVKKSEIDRGIGILSSVLAEMT